MRIDHICMLRENKMAAPGSMQGPGGRPVYQGRGQGNRLGSISKHNVGHEATVEKTINL